MGQQGLMRAALGDAALVKDDDFVGPDNGRQPMSNDQGGPVARHSLERVLDFLFGRAVERGRRFVEHQNAGVLQHGARDGDTLLLAARQLQAPLADLGVVTAGSRANEGIELRPPRRLFDLGIGG
jgi:hypothetical protein